MFSVVIPLYNKEKYIARTIRSVLEQSVHAFEIIVVDDGSTDNSINEVKKFDDDRIHIVHQENGGVSAARNRGIAEARYDLIAFLDADDLWETDFLETVFKLKDNYKDCSVFAVNYKILSYNGSTRMPIIKGLPNNFQEGILENYFEIASQSDPLICSISLAVRKEALETIGGFPVGIRAGEDLLTWAILAAHFNIAYKISPKAIFCRWDTPEHNIPRTPDKHDKVGEDLQKLLTEGDKDKIVGLEKYIAYWYKIRVAIFLRLEKRIEAKKEFKKMSKFSEKNIKYFIYAFLVYSPKSIQSFFSKIIVSMNSIRRKYKY